MDLRQLHSFLRLYEEGSVTRAARRLNIVQPALSTRIAQLEEELGCRLFDRTPRGVRPTPDGHRAYELFAPILQELAEARRRIADQTAPVRGRITVGLIASVGDSVLARSLTVFAERHPEVEVAAFEGYSTTLLDWVRAGLIDLAVVNHPAEDSDLQITLLLDEPFVLIGAIGSSLPQSPIPLRDLASLRLVLPTKRHGLRTTIDRAAEREHLVLPVRMEVDALAAIEELVAQPDWFTILPAITLRRSLQAGRLRAHPLLVRNLRRRVVCVSSARSVWSPARQRFIEILQAELAAQTEALARNVDALSNAGSVAISAVGRE